MSDSPGRAVVFIVMSAAMLSGCGWIMGESFVAQDLRNPKTGETIVCKGHLGRGSPTEAEIAAMNKCVASYEQMGWQRI